MLHVEFIRNNLLLSIYLLSNFTHSNDSDFKPKNATITFDLIFIILGMIVADIFNSLIISQPNYPQLQRTKMPLKL